MIWRPRLPGRRWRIAAGLAAALALLPVAGIELVSRCAAYPAGQLGMPPPSVTVVDRHGAVLGRQVSARGDWCVPVAADAFSPWLGAAVEAVEDRRFRSHGGIDWLGIGGALLGNTLHLRTVRGGSTITMQVERLRAAQADRPRPRSLATKLVEAVRARQIERSTDKDAILAEWLNRAPFGANLVGAEAAARHWFGVPAAQLTLAQAALLAGLPQRPERLRPDRHPQAARDRRDTVLALMRNQGRISADACAEAMAEPITLAMHSRSDVLACPVIAADRAAATGDPAIVTTTRDAGIEAAATAALDAALARAGSDGVVGAVVVVDRASGATRAVAGRGGPPGSDPSRARRSPGSALKPFIYAAAFADGLCRPGSLLDDRPRAWTAWTPANIDGGYRGRMTAAEALAESRNLPAMDLLGRVSVTRVGDDLEALGIPGAAGAARRAGLALAVGGIEVTPRQLAAAYAALARRAATSPAAASVLAALADPARTAAISPAGAAAGLAWKTGTSTGNRDAWCCAVGGSLVAVVWVGVDAGAGPPGMLGAEVAAPACLDLLAGIDPAPTDWSRPPVAGHDPLRAAPPRLVITSPGDGAEIIADGGPPRVRLACAGGQGEVWWFNGATCLGRSGPDGGLWWTPPTGRHTLRAVDDGGGSTGIAIVVR
jgi:penicillin-binding protein 1C